MSLSTRKFPRVLDVGKIFVVSNDSDRVSHALDVLFPFLKCEDNSEEFTDIYVIIPFSRDKHFREVGARVSVAIGIILEEDSSSGKERGIGHDGEWPRDVRNTEDGAG